MSLSSDISAYYYDADSGINRNLAERIKAYTPAEQEAMKRFWRSVVMRTPRPFIEENGRLPSVSAAGTAQCANVRSCKCCPYGYHIDLDFVRYCEALANARPSEEELRRRSRRLSRKSMDFMLGLESLFDQWDAGERVHVVVPEMPHESEPDSPHLVVSSTPYSNQQRPRSSSVPRFTYGALARSESPFGTASSTSSSLRGAESDVPFPMRRPAVSPPETRAFLHDVLDEVCSDFERTLERASVKRKKTTGGLPSSLGGAAVTHGGSDRNNNSKFGSHDKRNGNTWDHYFEVLDSCVTGNKSPRNSRSFSRSSTMPFQRRPSPAEQQYESYVQATVAANNKSPVETPHIPPPPPPRRHPMSSKILSPAASSDYMRSPLSERAFGTLLSPTSQNAEAASNNTAADAQTLFNIRQQMALSLKRMKDLEEQVKGIPELQDELNQLRNEKQRLQQTLHRKEEELHRSREITRLSSSPSPGGSPKHASPVQFTPQRISPISLESLGARLRTNSTSSERQLKSILKRDVATMCGLRATRDIAVGSPVMGLRSVGTSPAQVVAISELLYTQIEMEERIRAAIQRYEEHRKLQQLKNLISVGTQMYIPKQEIRDSSMQTMAEKCVLKYAVGIMAKPATRENFVQCQPLRRTVGSSEDRITDILCEKCNVIRKMRNVACGTEVAQEEKAVPKIPERPLRSNTFSLGDNEKLNIKRKTIGTQYDQVTVHSAGSQTSMTVVHTVGVQNTPEMLNIATQSHIDSSSRYTDTRDLMRLCTTQTSTEEIATPAPAPPKPVTRSTSSNTEKLKMVENGVNTEKLKTADYGVNTEARKTAENGVNTTLPPHISKRHFASNTEEVHKRDIACGDVVKPHISIACADNYCDSCKDAIKNLAKDFSKVLVSPVPTRSAESKIPRPKHLTSPIPVRKLFQRQNTYTITPSPSPSPQSEKKSIMSSLQEKPPAATHFHQQESVSETQSFITEPTKLPKSASHLPTETEKQQDAKPQEDSSPAMEIHVGDSLIVREEKRVSISWSRDGSPAPKSLENSFHEQLSDVKETSGESKDSSSPDVSKGARKKTSIPKSSQIESSQIDQRADTDVQEETPSTALLQQLAMDEARPRKKYTPKPDMLAALKIINDSLLKKMSAKHFSSSSLKDSKITIQNEWFRVSSTEKANPHEVEDYLDCFEAMSVPLLEYCVNLTDGNGNTAMHYAVSHGNFDVVSILLDSKVCNVNQTNNAGYTCVMLVSLAKLKNAAHRTVVERLFQMADVNIRAKKHCQTALMLAVSHGNQDMMEMLLNAGADINIQDEDGSTALMCAAEHGRLEIIKILLTQPDCDSLLKDVDGSTAFKIAWQAGHRDIGLMLYVHEQMLRSKLPNRGEPESTNPPALSPEQ